jgi:hypothetical protein
MLKSVGTERVNEVRKTLHFGRANCQDIVVLEKLEKGSVSKLAVDAFAGFLCKENERPTDDTILRLRASLMGVYLEAARIRREGAAAKSQIERASRALNLFTKGLNLIDEIRPPKRRGLHAVFGSPVDDIKGLEESNDFGDECQRIRLEVTRSVLDLQRAIESQSLKPTNLGERKKRLRILVELLAKWWVSETGRSIAPYVKAKRLDHPPAFVEGRSGDFLSLAEALFFQLDEFNESEVIAAVTNVHEGLSTTKKSAAISTK